MPAARILIAEDECITAMDIEERLQRLGYTVPAVVSSGEGAIRKVEETRPDLVLMDIVLSGDTDGVCAAQEIQSRLGTPIVYLTAYSDNATWERAKATEPFGYLVKPVKDTDLFRSIEIALQRREAEKRPLDKERWVGQFADCSGIAMMTFDQSSRVTFMNSVARDLTGLEQSDAVGKDVREVFRLPGRKETFSSIANAVKTCVEADVAYDAWLASKDGVDSPFQYSVVPMDDKQGNKVGAILFFRTIDRIDAKEKVHERPPSATESRLPGKESDAGGSESEEPLRVIKALVHKSPQASVILSAEGCVLFCNSAFEKLFLYRQQEILGSKLDKLILIKDAEAETFEVSQSVLSGQALHTTGFRRGKDGTHVVVELYSVPLFLNGELKAIYVSYQDMTQRMLEEERLREQATCDALTGLVNYRSFVDVLKAEIRRSERSGRTFATLLLDLDDLKKINDRFGHSIGNRALCRVAQVLRANCRAVDTAARYGGDEFGLILVETNETAAWQVSRRISTQLATGGEMPTLTISVGVAVYPRDGETVEALLEAADLGLYGVKRRRGQKLSKPA